MFAHLQIDDPAERRLVGLADVALRALSLPGRAFRRPASGVPARILVFRLERVGDLLMARPGLALLRHRFAEARIDLVVGSWNRPLAGLFPEVDAVQTLDLPWVARGDRSSSASEILSRVREWRRTDYDLAVNFEGDIRSHLLLRASGARRRAGFPQAGGGPLLDTVAPYDPHQHSAWNILRLAALAGGTEPTDAALAVPRLVPPPEAQVYATALLERPSPATRLIGVHPSAGRRIKQWPPEALAAVATKLAHAVPATVVVTGSLADRPIGDAFLAALGPDIPVVDLTGRLDLVQLAAALQRLDLFLGCDSGPMHLAAAVGTPVVAVFGPSDPVRWGPLGGRAEAVRVDLPCSPCNRIRKPPERCRDVVPDCLAFIRPDDVFHAAQRLMSRDTTGNTHARA
jgi:lipopolysaccharide heptosyltransferase II